MTALSEAAAEKEQRDALLQRYLQTRSIEDRNAVATANSGLLGMVAGMFLRRRDRTFIPSFDELKADGSFGLLYAVEHFDPARGVQFSTFATPCIYRCMRKENSRRIQQRGTLGKKLKLVSLNALKESQNFEATQSQAEYRIQQEQFVALIDRLGSKYLLPQQRDVFHLRFVEDLNLAEIGRRLGFSRERIRQIYDATIIRLQELPVQTILRDMGDFETAVLPRKTDWCDLAEFQSRD